MLKRLAVRGVDLFNFLGLDLRRGLTTFRNLPWYYRSYRAFKRSLADADSNFSLGRPYRLGERGRHKRGAGAGQAAAGGA